MIEIVQNKIDSMSEGQRVLFQVVGGSRLFGYSVPSSDYDVRVVTLPDKLYFQPNLRWSMVGFDQFPSQIGDQYANSSVANIVDPTDNQDVPMRKYDIFVSNISTYLRQCLTGSYYLLANFMASPEECDFIEPQWRQYQAELVSLLPESAFIVSSQYLLRDVKDYLRRLDQNIAINNSVKELTKYTYVANFLQLKNLKGHGVDYLQLRNSELSKEQIKEKLYTIVGLLTDLSTRKHNKSEISVFKDRLCEILNLLYGEELFKKSTVL